ncbi:hypothetical protein [Streptomyces sp. NPDC127084]
MEQALIDRDSRRPWAVAEAVCWTVIDVQGRAASWAYAVGWLVLMTAM